MCTFHPVAIYYETEDGHLSYVGLSYDVDFIYKVIKLVTQVFFQALFYHW